MVNDVGYKKKKFDHEQTQLVTKIKSMKRSMKRKI